VSGCVLVRVYVCQGVCVSGCMCVRVYVYVCQGVCVSGCMCVRVYVYVCQGVCVSGCMCVSSDSVLSKTAIFPQKEGRKREISNESARGSSLREANV